MTKTCPFKPYPNSLQDRACDGGGENGCQLYVDLVKDRILNIGKDQKMADPDAQYIYEGCGLVTAIPWMLVNKVKQQ